MDLRLDFILLSLCCGVHGKYSSFSISVTEVKIVYYFTLRRIFI